jgi:hypothetical protein
MSVPERSPELRAKIHIHKNELELLKELVPSIVSVTPELLKICLIYGNLESFVYLMANGGDLFTISYSALFHASGNLKGENRIVEYLLKNNLVPITQGILNDSLYNASLHSSHAIMELLLDAGAEPEVRIGTNAVKLYDSVALKMLVSRGLDIDKKKP